MTVKHSIVLITLFTLLTGFIWWSGDESTMSSAPSKKIDPPFLKPIHMKWADSVMKTLTPDERIGQLFMVAAYSNRDQKHVEELTQLVKDQKIGGLIFFQGNPHNQALITNKLQKTSKVPLYISIDGEWGLAMRLDSTHKFPKQMTMGAIDDNRLIFDMGVLMARQCKRLGIHINFAPVADVNNNSSNPVINYRSFGEDKELVMVKALAYMQGMQQEGILANAKHFPGHGDTDADSHKTLPVVKHSKERLDTLELYPFKHLIDSGLGSIMVAHMHIPVLDNRPNRATTLSKKVVTELLKNELSFKGLTFTDALNMKGVSQFYEPGIVDVEALIAGNDILLFAENVPRAITEIKKAIEKGDISQKEIDVRCQKILAAKHWSGLHKQKPIKLENLSRDLNDLSSKLLNKRIYAQALTLIKNTDNLLPLQQLNKKKIAVIEIGTNQPTTFSVTSDLYCSQTVFTAADPTTYDVILEKTNGYNCFLINVTNLSQRVGKNYGFSKETDQLIASLKNSHPSAKVIVNFPGNPYALNDSKTLELADALLVGYEENADVFHLSAQVVFGGIGVKGKLPISINKNYKKGKGIRLKENIRFNYPTTFEEIGLSPTDFNSIDSVINAAIRDTVFPGCQIFAAKNGTVFYYKSFGRHTYDSTSKRVENTDIYDLASITKIASSTAALMKLQSEGILHVDSTLSTYLSDIVDSSAAYRTMKLKEMLTHQAGLVAWIPFYIKTMSKGEYKPHLYSKSPTEQFTLRVAENLYITPTYRDTILKRIVETKVGAKKYLYSDLGYYFINEIILRKTGLMQDVYMQENFYGPLGLSDIGYKPREKWDINRIPPTEMDKTFRKQLIHADVHDQGAAMLGGVAGHAGLFSNANDLGVMMQLFMQYGTYGGERYYSESVGKQFISAPYYSSSTKNRRGIGFDKPVSGSGPGPTCTGCASSKSFGHSGFTGTITWADPENGVVYVFLSNRVYTDAENKKIITLGIRSRVQSILLHASKKIK
jgi:beta-glucosidase-like glycosyl hydrolase/CubicO group peptidase (beta-lactamase class C family)